MCFGVAQIVYHVHQNCRNAMHVRKMYATVQCAERAHHPLWLLCALATPPYTEPWMVLSPRLSELGRRCGGIYTTMSVTNAYSIYRTTTRAYSCNGHELASLAARGTRCSGLVVALADATIAAQ